MPDIKRLHYYDYLFLVEKDFTDEQQYHRGMRLHHNKTLHRWGIAAGLQVEKVDAKRVKVKAGVAIDSLGQEIVLDTDYELSLAAPEYQAGSHIYITLSHLDQESDERKAAGVTGFARVSEIASIQAVTVAPPADGSVLQLAHFVLDGAGNIPGAAGDSLTDNTRRMASALIAPGVINTTELADGAVGMDKLTKDVQATMAGARGWVRLPFLPKKTWDQPAGASEPVALPEFKNFIGRAECGASGAGGCLEIPVPPRATQIKTFKIGGAKNKAGLDLELWRIGPKREDFLLLLKQSIIGTVSGGFGETFKPDNDKRTLSENHALALFVRAKGEADIYFVAVEFE